MKGFIVSLLLSFFSFPLLSETLLASFDSDKALQKVRSIENSIQQLSERSLKEVHDQLSELSMKGSVCVKQTETELSKLETSREALGFPSKKESAEIVQQRKRLEQEEVLLNNRLSECKLLVLQTEELDKRVASLLQEQKTSHLLRAGPPIWQILGQLPAVEYWFTSQESLVEKSGLDLFDKSLTLWLILTALVGLALGLFLSSRLKPLIPELDENVFIDKLFKAILGSFSRYAVALALFGAIALFMFFITKTAYYLPLLAAFCYGIFAFFGLLFINSVLLNPLESKEPLVHLPFVLAKQMSLYFKMLASILLLGYLFFALLLAQNPPIEILLFTQDIVIILLIVLLFWWLWLVGKVTTLSPLRRTIQYALVLLLAINLAVELLGYRNLAEVILLNLVQTLALMLAFWLVSSLVHDLSVGLAEGKGRLQLYLRQKMGLKPYEKEPGVYWLYLTIKLFLWVGLAIGLLSIWGTSEHQLTILFEKIIHGFEIGSFVFSPLKIIVGIAIFALLLIAFRILRDKLLNRWLTQSGMERGRAETASTLTTYLGFTIAILFGLVTAGVDFTDLAIIAGALSLGIGFGLQNVVNNFVSGLILLFERPIKTGDWIKVGNTEGHVKKVSIRSTLIQAFDRSDIVVPNSDFITQPVTNFMLRDNLARVRIPLSVAYGSDVELVEKIVLEIAKTAHPEIITNGAAPDPIVFFMNFGESALELELRVFIKDVEESLSVKSTLNFAIYKAFKAHGIEIPFPQRDVTVKNWPNMRSQS